MGSLLLALIYVCFISLGLPDSLLGSAWPMLHGELSVPVSCAGVISMVISLGTILSSLVSDRLLHKFGAGNVTAFSVLFTAAALYGYSVSGSYWLLLLWSVPYGLGAGGVDAVLNNYVALHYKAQHMSWLHCMWGVGASLSPYIMSFSLIRLDSWNRGYLIVSVIQIILCCIIFMSLPLWKRTAAREGDPQGKPLKLREIFAIPGAISCFITFFGYCALELTASLWASSYLVQTRGIDPEAAAGFAALFYIGITAGRGLNGFLAMKLPDRTLIRLGLGIICCGILLLALPLGAAFSLAGFIVIGLGCAPVYPCIIHMTPDIFGRERSQAMIGVQMAFAYTGFLIMPPFFGFIAEQFTIALLPAYLAVLLLTIFLMHENVIRKAKTQP